MIYTINRCSQTYNFPVGSVPLCSSGFILVQLVQEVVLFQGVTLPQAVTLLQLKALLARPY